MGPDQVHHHRASRPSGGSCRPCGYTPRPVGRIHPAVACPGAPGPLPEHPRSLDHRRLPRHRGSRGTILSNTSRAIPLVREMYERALPRKDDELGAILGEGLHAATLWPSPRPCFGASSPGPGRGACRRGRDPGLPDGGGTPLQVPNATSSPTAGPSSGTPPDGHKSRRPPIPCPT